jgi:hypothetical protein
MTLQGQGRVLKYRGSTVGLDNALGRQSAMLEIFGLQGGGPRTAALVQHGCTQLTPLSSGEGPDNGTEWTPHVTSSTAFDQVDPSNLSLELFDIKPLRECGSIMGQLP